MLRTCGRRRAPSARPESRAHAAAATASSALAARRPAGTGRPASASSALASASSRSVDASPPPCGECSRRAEEASAGASVRLPSSRRAATTAPPRGTGKGRLHASPMNAAASAASIASAMPWSGTMPRRISSAACSSGRFSASRRRSRPCAPLVFSAASKALHRRPPVGIRAAVAAREIEHQHVEVEAARHHGGEGRGHRRLVVPDEGVVVERIGDRDQRPERRLDPRAVLARSAPGNRRRGPRRCRP